MAVLPINWTQGSPITAQRISVKKSDETAWNGGFYSLYDVVNNTVITNDFATTINSVQVQSILFNTRYDIRVENVVNGSSTGCSMISQGIAFECYNFKGDNYLYVTNVTTTGFDVQKTNLTNYIDKVKFLVYDSTGTTLITSSPFINVTSNQAAYTFTGLTSSTNYRVYYQMATTVTNNNVTYDKLSDINSSINCYDNVATLGATTGLLQLCNNTVTCTTTVDANGVILNVTGSGSCVDTPIPYGTYNVTITKSCNCNPLTDEYTCNGVTNFTGVFSSIVIDAITPTLDCSATCT
jgi:hypothetical protein